MLRKKAQDSKKIMSTNAILYSYNCNDGKFTIYPQVLIVEHHDEHDEPYLTATGIRIPIEPNSSILVGQENEVYHHMFSTNIILWSNEPNDSLAKFKIACLIRDEAQNDINNVMEDLDIIRTQIQLASKNLRILYKINESHVNDKNDALENAIRRYIYDK